MNQISNRTTLPHPVMDNCLIGDNELIFTASKGRLPGVSCHFSKDQYKLHTQKLQIDNLSKNIQKKKEKVQNSTQLLNNGGKRRPQILTHDQRIEAIYLNQIHKISLRKIVKIIDSSYGAIRNAIELYKESGGTQVPVRTNSKKVFAVHKLSKRQSQSPIVNTCLFVTLEEGYNSEWPTQTLSINMIEE